MLFSKTMSILYESFVGPCVILKDHVHPLQLHVQSVPFTTKIVSLILTHGEVYSIQYYVKKLVSDLRSIGGFLPVSSTSKVALNTITPPPNIDCLDISQI